LPGPSLWRDDNYLQPATECATSLKGGKPANACRRLLRSSPRAQEEWKLEEALDSFEKEQY
jgi:adenosine deaminase